MQTAILNQATRELTYAGITSPVVNVTARRCEACGHLAAVYHLEDGRSIAAAPYPCEHTIKLIVAERLAAGAFVTDTNILDARTGEVIADAGEVLDDEKLYRLEMIGLPPLRGPVGDAPLGAGADYAS